MFDVLASGGMASVHYGRLVGARGFALRVAIKKLLPMIANDPSFVAMFADEARIASRIRHPNVVPTLDVIEEGGELFIAMEYVHGETLSRLLRACVESGERPPLDVAVRIVCDVLQGLHAAHEAKNDKGEPLHIVHRDVSPQNVMVGADGIARVVDFGIAKAIDQGHVTREGEVRGKMRYLAPEQLSRGDIDRRVDIFAAGILMWELATGSQMRPNVELPQLVTLIARNPIEPPSKHVPDVPVEIDAVVTRALATDPMDRFAHASEMATALSSALAPASHDAVGAWVRDVARVALNEREEKFRAIESAPLPQEDAPKKKSSRWRWALAVVPVAIGAIVLVRFLPTRAHEAVVAPSASSSVALVAPAASSSSPVSVATASVAPSTTTRPSIVKLRPRGVPKIDCRVPYVIDSTGVRVPKPECL
jgi:serine/threonine-protein kinase